MHATHSPSSQAACSFEKQTSQPSNVASIVDLPATTSLHSSNKLELICPSESVKHIESPVPTSVLQISST